MGSWERALMAWRAERSARQTLLDRRCPDSAQLQGWALPESSCLPETQVRLWQRHKTNRFKPIAPGMTMPYAINAAAPVTTSIYTAVSAKAVLYTKGQAEQGVLYLVLGCQTLGI